MLSKVPFIDQSAVAQRACFYVGGALVGEAGRRYMANQMFVEAYAPKESHHPYPVIMFHGAGQTNMNWLATPDGRMGWCDYFVSKGYTVFLAEQPARARSAWHPEVNGPTIHHTAEAIQERFVTDWGKWPQAKKHTQWPGDGTNWDDETLKQFLSSQVEYLPSNEASQALVLEAGKELLKLTGPAILLTHSQAGPFGWLLADACPELVKGVVALEPTAPPFSQDISQPVAKNYGIAGLPLHYEPPVSTPEDIELELLKAPVESLSDGWVMKEPARKLPNFKDTAVLLITSEGSYHAGGDHLVSHVLTQCGVKHTYLRLEDAGIHGNGHMMMLEKNNLDIADWILNWLKSHVG